MTPDETTPTGRPTVPALEEILLVPFPALDHGFVRVIDYFGNDDAVVQAARVSYGKGTKTAQEDSALIRYLMRHLHTTPFEMCEIKLHVKLPIFVARQWIRHRTANVNEYSARYSILDKEFYVPSIADISAQSASNRQGRGAPVAEAQGEWVRQILMQDAERSYENYLLLLNESEEGTVINEEREGVARELARMNLSLNFYTQWYWKSDLHNLLHFLRLRTDSHAQKEIRVYAEIIGDIVRRWMPATYQAFLDYRVHGAEISAPALKVIKRLIAGDPVTLEDSGLSKREWRELQDLLD